MNLRQSRSPTECVMRMLGASVIPCLLIACAGNPSPSTRPRRAALRVPIAESLRALSGEPEITTLEGMPLPPHPRYHHAQSVQRACAAGVCHFLISHSDVASAYLVAVGGDGDTQRIELDTEVEIAGQTHSLAHAGGMQLSGDVLAIALTRAGEGLDANGDCGPRRVPDPCEAWVLFYDVSNLRNPRRLRELDLHLDGCAEGAPGGPTDGQAVGLHVNGTSMHLAVLTSVYELRFYERREGGDWQPAGRWSRPRAWRRSCELRGDWCRPSTIHLMEDPAVGLVLLAFGGSFRNGRIDAFAVNWRAPDPTLIRLGATVLPNVSSALLAAAGGAFVDDDGALTVLAAAEHLYGPEGCLTKNPPAIVVYRSAPQSSSDADQ